MDAFNLLCSQLKYMLPGDFLWYHVDTVFSGISKAKDSLGN